MANYSYQGISESGATVSGTIEAGSPQMAENLLVAKGYIPSKIKETTQSGMTSILANLRAKLGGFQLSDLILFTKQFRSMLNAGVPMLRLLQVLEHQTQNQTLKKAVTAIHEDIKAGTTLYEAMKKHPAIFSTLYLSMINAGEISGTVPDVLDRVVAIMEHEEKVKSDIKSAVRYPIIVLIALGLAFFILLTFVIPKFVTIFTKVGITLPWPTKIALVLYQAIANYWYIMIGGAAALIIGLWMYLQTDSGRYVRDTFFMNLPIMGPLFQKAAMSRFASIFAILQQSGVPVMQTMEVLSGTIGNTAIAREFDRVRDRVQEGQGISGPLSSAKYFTPMVVDMVAIGEESGNIEDMLRAIALHYDDEVKYAVQGLSTALGPILIVGLAAVVGFFALAIFLPMWDMTKMVK